MKGSKNSGLRKKAWVQIPLLTNDFLRSILDFVFLKIYSLVIMIDILIENLHLLSNIEVRVSYRRCKKYEFVTNGDRGSKFFQKNMKYLL
jgi:hypothetical protein